MRLTLVALFTLSAASALGAQAPASPPLRQLPAATARSAESFGLISGIRQLPGGRVLVNEPMKRRVILLDSALANATVVADSTGATANAYSGRTGGLIAWKGDSTLFVDPAAMSMLLIEPSGKIGRVMSVPRSQDAGMIAGGFGGAAVLDPAGRLIYRAAPAFSAPARGANGAFVPPQFPDSAAIVRVDIATRALDTVAFIRTPKITMNMQTDSLGRVRMSSILNPLPVVDEWAVLADGSIAIVRGRDYHVDFIRPDGTRQSAPKVPFEWQRLTDEDKVTFLDSVKVARERMMAQAEAAGGTRQVITTGPGGAGATPMGGGGEQRVMIMMGPGGDGPPRRGGAAAGAGAGAAGGATAGGGPQVQFVSPSELPDYKPPFFAGAVRADADGHMWIRTIPTKAVSGGLVYDVIDAQGALVSRVQLPPDRTIVGFGKGGVVYMLAREEGKSFLERSVLR